VTRRLAIPILAAAAGCAAMIAAMAADRSGAREVEDFGNSLKKGIEARTQGKVASEATRNVFSAKDHASGKYTRNPRLWCADLVPQLTGCAVWKPPLEYAGERYGGVMITSRHILFCRHSHPAWDGGWMKVQPQIIRFVTKDSKVVDMKLIANADSRDADLDLCVGLLHAAVPESIHVAPIMPPMSAGLLQRFAASNVPDISVSQAGIRPDGQKNESMVYAGDSGLFAGKPGPWGYTVYQGDSGTPRFYLTPAGLALYQLTGAGSVHNNLPRLKALIEACDDSAIARGVLKKRTGLAPTVVKLKVPSI
jgi:hypothetical protein